MGYSSVFRKDLPRIQMSKNGLTELTYKVLSPNSSSFQFNDLLGAIARYLLANRAAYAIPDNTDYNEVLDQTDRAKVREVIWDLIVLRYLTIGDYHNDEWPHLSITDSGKEFLLALTKSAE